MKTKLWMLGAAVAALTSCTQSEVVEIPESRVIGFEPFVGKASRSYTDVASVMLAGAGAAANDLNAFWVYGSFNSEVDTNDDHDLFTNTHVYWDANNNAFTYANPKQWYEGTYYFSAYSDGNNTLSNGVSADLINRKLTFTNYVNDGNKDLVAAIPAIINKSEANMSQGVSFHFKHMLACVELKFTNASTAFALDFTDVKFNANSVGTCVYTEESTPSIVWSNQGTSVEYELKTNTYDPDDENNNNPTVLLQPGQFARLYCFVIPQNNESVELSFAIKSYERKNPTTAADGTTTYDYHYSSTEHYKASLKVAEDRTNYKWDAGRLYRYNAEVSGSAHYINFAVQAVENWNAEGNVGESTMTPGKVQNP